MSLSYFKYFTRLYWALLLTASIFSCVCCLPNNDFNHNDTERSKVHNETLESELKLQGDNNTLDANNGLRAGRGIHLTRTPMFAVKRRVQIPIRPRADYFTAVAPGAQVRRRRPLRMMSKSPGPLLRFGYEGPAPKITKFTTNTKTMNAPPHHYGNGKSSRPLPAMGSASVGGGNGVAGGFQTHPNSLTSPQYIQNFKNSPTYNVKMASLHHHDDGVYGHKYNQPQQAALVAGQASSLLSMSKQQQQHQQQVQQDIVKQYPIPDQEKLHKYNEQHKKYLKQQQYLTQRDPMKYYYQQQQQQQLQQQLQHSYLGQQQAAGVSSTTQSPHMYAVYEESDVMELPNNNNNNNNYLGATKANDEWKKEANNYLRFMSSNEYFLPKMEPNYRHIDEETEKRQNHLQQQQQQQQQYIKPAFAYELKATQKPVYYSTEIEQQQQQQQQQQPKKKIHTTIINKPIKVSKLYYPDNTNISSSSSGSTVVRTSYSTGHKSKHIINVEELSVSSAKQTPAPIRYSSRTPEPLRFEFTEQDAVVAGTSDELGDGIAGGGSVIYTNSPKQHLKYKLLGKGISTKLTAAVENSTPALTYKKYSTTTNIYEHDKLVGSEDDPEDQDDIQGLQQEQQQVNAYNRQPPFSNQHTLTDYGIRLQNEQNDTEAYCENICATVQDDNDEIVCGTDSYMYTSEAQLECYASCLHIEITIQSKGTCTAAR